MRLIIKAFYSFTSQIFVNFVATLEPYYHELWHKPKY